MTKTLSIGALLLALVPVGVSAQTADGGAEPRFIFGPLGITPRVALKDVGIDSNPGNLPIDTRQDFTATLAPGVDTVLRVGRGRLLGKTTVEYVYFSDLESQRSFNVNQEVRAEVTLNRLTPFASGGYLRTRQRPNPEIDLRVQQNAKYVGVGAQVKIGGRSNLELEGRRAQLRFGEGTYGDDDISQALDRDTDSGSASFRTALTPQTTFVVRADGIRDDFANDPVRSSDSISVQPGFEFKPTALLAGRFLAGYRRFDARDQSVPDFGGLIGLVDMQYTWREQTRFAFKASRNIEYSVEDSQPYYVANGGTIEVTQVIGVRWYVAGRGGRTRLVYRNFIEGQPTSADAVGRTDRVDLYGVGFGRRLTDDIRIGLDLNKVRRVSTIPVRQYEGYRVGVSISYGS